MILPLLLFAVVAAASSDTILCPASNDTTPIAFSVSRRDDGICDCCGCEDESASAAPPVLSCAAVAALERTWKLQRRREVEEGAEWGRIAATKVERAKEWQALWKDETAKVQHALRSMHQSSPDALPWLLYAGALNSLSNFRPSQGLERMLSLHDNPSDGCVESAPVSDKWLHGGSASPQPSISVFRVCFFRNVTQWTINERGERAGSTVRLGTFGGLIAPSLSVDPTTLANPTPERLVHTWRRPRSTLLGEGRPLPLPAGRKKRETRRKATAEARVSAAGGEDVVAGESEGEEWSSVSGRFECEWDVGKVRPKAPGQPLRDGDVIYFTHGEPCSDGSGGTTSRTVAVQLVCPPSHAANALAQVLNVEEDHCAYRISVATPVVCHK
jgi:hypothetical protein